MLLTREQSGVTMAAKTVGIAIDEQLKQALDEVVAHYAGGNRSEFLRMAVREYQGRMKLERLNALRDEARAERGGRIYTLDEVMELIETGIAPS